MTNTSKRKGTVWETRVVDYLRAHGVVGAERRALNGTQDRGDIAGLPGVVIEAKNERPYRLAQWLAEADRESLNDGAELAFVWAKRVGRAGAEHGYVIMTPETLMHLLYDAGRLDVPVGYSCAYRRSEELSPPKEG